MMEPLPWKIGSFRTPGVSPVFRKPPSSSSRSKFCASRAGSKNEYPPLAGPYGAMLGTRYDPIYTDFTPEGTRLAPEIHPGRAFKDPLLGINPTDKLNQWRDNLPS